MTGPAWLAAGFAALMLLVAVSCAIRLGLWGLRGRDTELDADALHVVMGVAMAGMFEPRLSLLPGAVWLGLFVGAAAWFSGQALRARGGRRPARLRCAVPAPHAVECAVMLYMLWPGALTGHGAVAAMPGMNGASATAAANPVVAVVLAVFVLGYLMWTTDRLAALSRARVSAARAPVRLAWGDHASPGQSGSAGGAAAISASVSGSALAPRLAACYKIAMSIGMGYMLITLL